MSDTPRVDSCITGWGMGPHHAPSLQNFVRDLERELHEQCVLNGKGAEREAALLGKVDRLERENARLRLEALSDIAALAEKEAENARLATELKAARRTCGELVADSNAVTSAEAVQYLRSENVRLRETLADALPWLDDYGMRLSGTEKLVAQIRAALTPPHNPPTESGTNL